MALFLLQLNKNPNVLKNMLLLNESTLRDQWRIKLLLSLYSALTMTILLSKCAFAQYKNIFLRTFWFYFNIKTFSSTTSTLNPAFHPNILFFVCFFFFFYSFNRIVSNKLQLKELLM